MHPDLEQFLRLLKSRMLPDIKPWKINEWSRNCYHWFAKWDLTKNDEGQRDAYQQVFDRLGEIGRFNYQILGRCDKRTVGEFACYLLDNHEVVLWKHVWPLILPRLQALHPNIPLGWEYNGVSEDPYVIFFMDQKKADGADFRIIHATTRQRVAVVEFKDGAIFDLATYKDMNIRSYAECDDVFMLTTFREHKHGPLMYYSWLDKNDLVNMLDENYAFPCSWFGGKDVYCFKSKAGQYTKHGQTFRARALHPLFDWNTGVKVQ